MPGVSLAKAGFNVGTGTVQIDTVLADVDGLRIGGLSGGKILECSFNLGKKDHEAGVVRGLLDGGAEKVEELWLAAVFQGVERRLLAETRILRECG